MPAPKPVSLAVPKLAPSTNGQTKVGELGGQAQVTGVDGTWKLLTDSVNMMAANLTAQVRAIGEVSIAVTKGDL
jgi:hypothetical protein